MSSNDYVKFMTEQIVGYISQPKEERKQNRINKKSERLPFQYRWFGLIPLALSLGFKKRK